MADIATVPEPAPDHRGEPRRRPRRHVGGDSAQPASVDVAALAAGLSAAKDEIGVALGQGGSGTLGAWLAALHDLARVWPGSGRVAWRMVITLPDGGTVAVRDRGQLRRRGRPATVPPIARTIC